jgi:uncharacterized protein YecT (DUF1311 family)
MWILFALAVAAVGDSHCSSTKTDDLIACAESKFERADRALNAEWRKLPHSKEMVRAQRAWSTFRDAECIAANPANPQGREYLINKILCEATLTEQRTEQLRKTYGWR